MSVQATPAGSRVAGLLFWGGLLVYVLGFMAWYSTTPLGLVPAADDREILALARQIASASLPHEAFYRAPGYPALLALGLWLGVPDPSLVVFARGLNSACHLASTALVFLLAQRLWGSRRAAWLAAGLVGFNPVLLHFAADALDITLAITLMLLGFAALFARSSGRPATGWAALALGVAGLCRPQLMPLLVLPVLMAVRQGDARRQLPRTLLAALLPLLAMASVNQLVAGDFRMTPWQGAFNLWAANHPGANGRYFSQTLSIESYAADANTARLESEALYRRDPATAGAGDDYRAMTRYWQHQALQAMADDPARWLALMGQKLRYLLSNEEQYNNKTYAFHKARSPWLAPNPVCWALILALAAAGLVPGWQRPALRWVVLGILLCAGSVLLFYVSDRFRAPLVPLLALLAGGVLAPGNWRRPLGTTGAVAAALVLAFWPPAYPVDETVVQDRMMLAASASALGRYAEALAEIRAAGAAGDTRPGFIALRCVVGFNAWLAGSSTDEAGWAQDCRRAASTSESARLQAAHADWRLGRDADAIKAWRSLAAGEGPARDTALAALRYVGAISAPEQASLSVAAAQGSRIVLATLAAAGGRNEPAWRQLVEVLGEDGAARNVAAIERLWSRPRGASAATRQP